jgi:hypothetical protein
MKLETAAIIFKWVVFAIGVIFCIDGSFHLMSTRSTVENVIGLLLFVVIALGTILIAKHHHLKNKK